MYGNVDLEGVVILENHALHSGGGVVLAAGYDGGRIANNYVVRNSADVVDTSLHTADNSVEIANNTIVGDSSSTGIYVDDNASGMLKLTNNVVVNHTAGIEKVAGASVTLANNDVWGNTTNYLNVSPGSGDISVDPDFVDPGNDDHHLDADSQCIDSGTTVDELYFDYDGDRRTGALLDIGADEIQTDAFFIPLTVRRYTP